MTLSKPAKKRLGEILTEEGLLDAVQLAKALEKQKEEGGMLGAILVRLGHISEEMLTHALSKQLSLPYLQLSKYQVSREAVACISRDWCMKHLCFPFEKDERRLSLALAEPLETDEIERLKKQVGTPLQFFLSSGTEVKGAIEKYYG